MGMKANPTYVQDGTPKSRQIDSIIKKQGNCGFSLNTEEAKEFIHSNINCIFKL